MGGCLSDEDRAAYQLDKEISKKIKEDKEREENIIKILLLGTGDSGKSTIAKQMKILYIEGYSLEERKNWKNIVFENILAGIKTLIQAARNLKIQHNEELASSVMKLDIFNSINAQIISSMWKDKGIMETYSQRSKFHLSDSTNYYLDSIERFAEPNYIPTEQDILHARTKTIGIVELEFMVEGLKFKIFDVGGQRNERRKWIHIFQDVTTLMFVVAASEYDQTLLEDENTNRIEESLQLFGEICNSKWFLNTNIILFFNKRDIFEEKIKNVDLSIAFNDYKGGKNFEEACDFIQRKFEEKNENPMKQIYCHFTCATDTNNIKVVFNIVKDIILGKMIQQQEGSKF